MQLALHKNGMNMRLKCLILSVVLIGSLSISKAAIVDDDQIVVYKSMFIYNFIKHIQWPVEVKSIQIGVVGNDDQILAAFEKMAKTKSTPLLQINVKKITPAESASCQIVYVLSRVNQIDDLLSEVKEKPIVIIADNENLLSKTAFISFKLLDNKLKFKINKDAFDRSGLKISSSLISMAI